MIICTHFGKKQTTYAEVILKSEWTKFADPKRADDRPLFKTSVGHAYSDTLARNSSAFQCVTHRT